MNEYMILFIIRLIMFRMLAVWLRKHDHEKCSELGAEINYIEDAMKALEKGGEQ